MYMYVVIQLCWYNNTQSLFINSYIRYLATYVHNILPPLLNAAKYINTMNTLRNESQ